MRDWFRRRQPAQKTPAPRQPAQPPPPHPEPPAQPSPIAGRLEAVQYLERVKAKMARLAEEFAAGTVNRAQFQELFQHYQNERRTIETWLDSDRDSASGKKAAPAGQSGIIPRGHAAVADDPFQHRAARQTTRVSRGAAHAVRAGQPAVPAGPTGRSRASGLPPLALSRAILTRRPCVRPSPTKDHARYNDHHPRP